MSRFALVVVVGLTVAGRTLAAGPFDDLLKYASANTNSIVLIDVKGAFGSEVAKKEKWAEKSRQSDHGALGFVPPDAERLAITGEINLTTMVRDFQIGLVKVSSNPNLKTLATREEGSTDEIAGQLTVVSPRGVYFTSFPGSVFAACYPADRQYTARWLKAQKAGKLPGLAPYLRKAADAAGDSTVVIALDLEDFLDPAAVRAGLPASPIMVKHKGVHQFALSVFLGRVKGMTFSAKVTDTVTGKLVIEFPEDVNRYKGVVKDLFFEIIDACGISIAGMDKWEATYTDTTMTLSGSMSAGDLKRILSLFSFPHPGMTEEQPGAGNEPTAGATKRYLAAIDSILADIKHVRDNNNYTQTATWHEKAAAQLDQVSRRNVDPLAIEATYEASKRLRAIAESLRGVPLDLNALASKAYVYTQRTAGFGAWAGFRRGWWGGPAAWALSPTFTQTNLPEIQGEMAKVIADDQKKRSEAWGQIDQGFSSAKRKLTDKYKTPF